MPIRTDDEHRSALARLDQERIILRSRSFTDDEQRDFDSLTSDIAAYEATQSPNRGKTVALEPSAASPPVSATASCSPNLLVDNMRARLDPTASMHRELARQGLAPAPQPSAGASTAMASMEREIRRMGLTPRGAA